MYLMTELCNPLEASVVAAYSSPVIAQHLMDWRFANSIFLPFYLPSDKKEAT